MDDAPGVEAEVVEEQILDSATAAQTKIDAEKRASWMPGRKCFEDPFSQPVKEFVIRNVRRQLAFLTVEKKKINVRTVI